MRPLPRFIDVQVRGVAVEAVTERWVLLLCDPGERLVLPIPLGRAEARALAMLLQGRRGPRPSTHDLLGATVASLDARVLRVDLRSVEGDRFQADVILQAQGGRRIRLDASAVDAVALALRAGAPIRASRAVLETARLPADRPMPRASMAVIAGDTVGRARLMADLADLAPDDLANC